MPWNEFPKSTFFHQEPRKVNDMTEHPIIFSAEMVRAILDDRKTQTRRLPIERYQQWQVGDTLRVKESYQIEQYTFRRNCVGGKYLADNKEFWTEVYQREYDLIKNRKFPLRATSGRFMYKSFARIFLEITNIRDERVQDISWRDCEAEGITLIGDELVFNNQKQKHSLLRTKFKRLWDSLNAKRGYGWAKKPEVKVIEFKRLEKNNA